MARDDDDSTRGWWLAAAILSPALYFWGFLYPQSEGAHAIFAVSVVGGLLWTKLRQPSKELIGMLGLWGAMVVANVAMASDPWRAFWSTHERGEGGLQHLLYIGLLLLMIATPNKRRMVQCVLAMVVGCCLWGLLPLGWGLPGELGLPRLQGGLGNALYLGSALIFGIWAALRLRYDWIAGLLIGALILTGAKGAILGLIVAGIFSLIATNRLGLGFLATLALVIGLILLPAPDNGATRVTLWSSAWEGIKALPMGWGPEGFPAVWDRWWQPLPELWHDRAHSMYLDRAIEWGIPGLAGFLGVLVLAFKRAKLIDRFALVAYAVSAALMFDMMAGMVGLMAVVAVAEDRR